MTRKVDWSAICTTGFLGDEQIPMLSRSEPVTTAPEVEGQIGTAEVDVIIQFFKKNYLPAIEMAAIEPDDMRFLEIGAGFGRLAYGTLKCVIPEMYIATDVFSQLIGILETNLIKWRTSATATGAAILNPSDELTIKRKKFNIIHSHSVLHHVLDWKRAVVSLYDRLDTPGVLIFAEPSTDGYLFILSLIKTSKLLQELAPEHRFTDTFINAITNLETNLTHRVTNHNNLEVLAQYGHGDKHIFGVRDFMGLAAELGARLYIPDEREGLLEMALGQLQMRGADENDRKLLRRMVTAVIPPGSETTMFSSPRIIFCFIKMA